MHGARWLFGFNLIQAFDLIMMSAIVLQSQRAMIGGVWLGGGQKNNCLPIHQALVKE
jgi:hypothetical protein